MEGESESINPNDFQLHAVLSLGLSLGLRFDGNSKITLKHHILGGGQISFIIAREIKNFTKQRKHEVKECPGN